MKKGDQVIWDNEPQNIAKIQNINADGTANIRYPGQKHIVTVPLGTLTKV